MGGRAPCSQKPRSQEAARRAIGVGIRVRRKSWDQQRLLERAERGGAYLSSGFEAVVKTGLGSGIQIAQKSELNRRVATAMGAARTATAVVVEGGGSGRTSAGAREQSQRQVQVPIALRVAAGGLILGHQREGRSTQLPQRGTAMGAMGARDEK